MKWLKRLLGVAYDTKPSELSMFLQHQERSEARYHALIEAQNARIGEIIAAMNNQRESDNERSSELVSTLDKIVMSRFERSVSIGGIKPNISESPLPASMLSDVLSLEDDGDFIKQSTQIFN